MPVHFLNESQAGIQAMAKWLEEQLFQNLSYFILFHLSTLRTLFHIFIFLCNILRSTKFLQVKKFIMIFLRTPLCDFWYLYETKFRTAHSFVLCEILRDQNSNSLNQKCLNVLSPMLGQFSLTMADHTPALYTHTDRSIPNHQYPLPIEELWQNLSKFSSKFRWNLG